MKCRRWAVGVVATVLLCVSTEAFAAAEKKADSTDKTNKKKEAEVTSQIAVFRLHGPLQEAPPQFDFGFDMEPRQSLPGLLERVRKARKDDSVKAVVLTFDNLAVGWAQMQELRQAVGELKAADKDVYSYLEEVGAGVYQLATAGSRICISPIGGVDLIGLHLEEGYFKGLMDKIGVEADVEHIGAYKGAGEPFTRTGPSDEAKEMLNWLAKDLFEQMLQTIADGRKMTVDQARELVDRGPFTASEALEAKLVDEVAYTEAFIESLQKRYGKDIKLTHNYGVRKGSDVDLSSPFAIFKLFGEAMGKAKGTGKAAIGVVYLDGMIVSGRSEDGFFGDSGTIGSTTFRRVLNKARDDDSIKAVVLRVNSPGGSALASDIIWNAGLNLGGKKPLVVSMGNVAASGGYYVSVGAKTIFAEPGTITGSIGVLGGKLVTKGFWDWIGVSSYELALGKNADLYNSNRRFDDRQRALVRRQMQSVYDAFTNRVTKGRGDRLKKDIEELAGGRVFTGKQALAQGLVDKLGGLQDAIKFAAAEAQVSNYEIRALPERKNFFDVFIRGLTGEEQDDDDAVDVRVAAATGNLWWPVKAPAIRDILPVIQQADPVKAQIVLRSLLRIALLGRENTLLVLPGEITIH